MIVTSKQRITMAIEKWYLIEPLYFSIWTTHELVINTNIKNIRVDRGRVEYNPQFIESLTDKELYSVLTFEAMRIILKHPYSRRKEIPQLSYEASNITIQEYLKTSLEFPYAKQVFNTSEYDQKYFEFYYFKLLEMMDKRSDGGKGDAALDADQAKAGCNKSTNRADADKAKDTMSEAASGLSEERSDSELMNEDISKKSLGDYADSQESGRENTEFWDSDNFISDIINEKINMAVESNNWGSIPYYIRERIIATLKPKLNYRQILKSFRGSILSVNRVLTRMKPSRRYGFLYLGSRRDFCTKLLFAVDVSGSVSNSDLRNAFSVINQLFKNT